MTGCGTAAIRRMRALLDQCQLAAAEGHLMADDTKTIEIWPCGYDARCKVQNCKTKETIIARGSYSGGRPIRQYELCVAQAEHVAERERANGRLVIKREVNARFLSGKRCQSLCGPRDALYGLDREGQNGNFG
jgi:hypothetical protein